MSSGRRKGSVTVEMTLVGIPVIFVLVSIFEISRGMWMYETASFAVREGVRFAAVHGVNCKPSPPTVTNDCLKTAFQVTAVIRSAAVALGQESLANTPVTFSVPSVPTVTSFNCNLDGTTGDARCSAVWPDDGANSPPNVISISLSTPFRSALAMFWPGSRPVAFGQVNLGASSSDSIQF